MSRKRTSTETPSTETATSSALPAAETASAELPTSQSAAPAGTEAVPTVGESTGGPSFVDRLGPKQRTSTPDPFGIAADYVVGVRLFESLQDRQLAMKFGDGSLETKPGQLVIDRMKEAGYRWNPRDRVWVHPIRTNSARSTRIEAERLFHEVRQLLRKEKGIEPSQEMDF